MGRTHVRAALATLTLLSVFPAGAAVAACLQSELITEPGHYTLCEDFVNRPIRITSSNVTLECAGHSVVTVAGEEAFANGPTESCVGGRSGIHVANDQFWIGNVVILNCVVGGWDSGIRSGFVEGLTLIGNSAHHNWDGFDLNQSSLIEMSDSVSFENGGTCQGARNGDGIDLDLVDGANFTRIDTFLNVDHGVTISNFHNVNPCGQYWNNSVTYRDSASFNNGGRGFNIRRTRTSLFENNWCRGNTQGAWRTECVESTTVNMPDCF